MCGVCACVREVCVVVLEQILQLYPDERLKKKQTLKLLFSKGYLIGERELCQQRLVAAVLAFFSRSYRHAGQIATNNWTKIDMCIQDNMQVYIWKNTSAERWRHVDTFTKPKLPQQQNQNWHVVDTNKFRSGIKTHQQRDGDKLALYKIYCYMSMYKFVLINISR